MGFLEIFQDAFSSSFYRAFLLFLSPSFQSSQLGLLLLDISALCNFKASVFEGTRDIYQNTEARRQATHPSL